MLELKEGCITAGGRVLVENLSFVAKAGQVTCLVGAKGSGKTLLTRTLLGLWPLNEGYVTLDGEPVTPLSAPWLRRLIAYVPQQLPEDFSDSLDALHRTSTDGKRVILVDDPFYELEETSCRAITIELQRIADEGLTVVLTSSERKELLNFKCYRF